MLKPSYSWKLSNICGQRLNVGDGIMNSMYNQVDGRVLPTVDETRDLIDELCLRRLYKQQDRQLPVTITIARYPEYFGLCPLSEQNILDHWSRHIPTPEKNRIYDSWVTDLSAVVNDYGVLLQRGFDSSNMESIAVPLCEANNTLTIEVKKDAWDFIRYCSGIESVNQSVVETGCFYRGHIVQPLTRAVRSEPRCDRVNAVVASIDKPISPNSDGNNMTILTKLTESGIISGQHLKHAKQGKIRAAPIIRELGIPCIVLDEHPEVHSFLIERMSNSLLAGD